MKITLLLQICYYQTFNRHTIKLIYFCQLIYFRFVCHHKSLVLCICLSSIIVFQVNTELVTATCSLASHAVVLRGVILPSSHRG